MVVGAAVVAVAEVAAVAWHRLPRVRPVLLPPRLHPLVSLAAA